MPSLIVHIGFAALIATALLGSYFNAKALNIAVLSVVIPDLDSLVSVLVPNTHRALLHNLFLPLILTILLIYDIKIRKDSIIKEKYSLNGLRLAITIIAVITFAGIGLDLFGSGVSLFYPLDHSVHHPEGKLIYSDQRGFIQTLVEEKQTKVGTTKTVKYGSGVDPSPPSEPKKKVERIIPIAKTGVRFFITMTGLLIAGIRVWEDRILNHYEEK